MTDGDQPPMDTPDGGHPATQPPGAPTQPPPYGQQGQSPYGQSPQAPYGQPQAPYGQPPQNPYAPPAYAQPAYDPSSYGQPYGVAMLDPDKRPGTVLAAGIIAISASALTAFLLAIGLVGLFVARDQILTEIENSPDFQTADFQDSGLDASSLFTIVLVMFAVLLIWSLVAIALAVLAMRRSKVGRILTVISAGMVAALSLVSIGSLVSVLWLVAAGVTIVLLFVGGANEWYSRQGGPFGPPSQPPW